MLIVNILFWLSMSMILYTYFGYPLFLSFLVKIKGKNRKVIKPDIENSPEISLVVPVHNEEKNIEKKLKNLNSLNYSMEKIQIIVISDGSTDNTVEIIKQFRMNNLKLIEISERQGKANALNKGIAAANHDIIVFTDASIMMEKDALLYIVAPFIEEKIGIVSGEDFISEESSEGAYGRYELYLRNLESDYFSIVGASGSFYAQRIQICNHFEEGMAPDFISVLNAIENGYIAITERRAKGYMNSVKSNKDEFQRKVRTVLRGMTALREKINLLNITKFPTFAFELISHKLFRWTVPINLMFLLITNLLLLGIKQFNIFFMLQIIFYLIALLSYLQIFNLHKSLVGKIALYFTTVNFAIIVAWFKYFSGIRQEIWYPSQR